MNDVTPGQTLFRLIDEDVEACEELWPVPIDESWDDLTRWQRDRYEHVATAFLSASAGTPRKVTRDSGSTS